MNKLGKDILFSYPPHYNEDSLNIGFNHYFLSNTGIFVGTAYCFEKIMIFSALHSISMFICIAFALLNAFFSVWSLSAAFAVAAMFLIFICNLSTEFPLRNDAHKTFLRTLLNFKSKYPNDDICKELDIAQTQIINPMAERLFFLRSSEITTNYFKHQKSTQNTNAGIIEKGSQTSYSTSSTQPPRHNAAGEPPESLDKNTIRYALWKMFLPECAPKYNDMPFFALYFILLKNREQTVSFNGFEMFFFHLSLNVIKETDKSSLDNFNTRNRHFKFSDYNEESDKKYYESRNYTTDKEFYNDINYSPENSFDLSKCTDQEIEYLNNDGTWEALMSRGHIRHAILSYFETRKKLLNMKIEDIESNIEKDREIIAQIEIQEESEANSISTAHDRLIQKAPKGTIIDMNWDSVYKLREKRIALETEIKFLSSFYEKVCP